MVSTRDCSLQRRHQKLVEEAPGAVPDRRAGHGCCGESSEAILREAGYVGAGTCEFLVGQDGTMSFLEVNTRLQVEHPVTEEVSGIDLVREMFRIADGEELGYDDPPLRGHSIEFRVNAEDPRRGFLPAPGTITTWRPPSGPGVRLDAGDARRDDRAAGVRLADRQADRDRRRPDAGLERSRRALAEFEIGGMPTVLPFHRAVVDDPAFTAVPFTVHTRWIETEFARRTSRRTRATWPRAEDAAAAGADHRRGRRQAAGGGATGGARRGGHGRRRGAAGRAAARPSRRAPRRRGTCATAAGPRAATPWSARCRARS